MIRVICPNCNSKLDAKDELLGQTRNCPKCKNPLVIRSSNISVNDGAALETADGKPVHLEPLHRYFILSPDRIIAHWENGKGWQINVGNGFANVRMSSNAIPDQGSFILVDLAIKNTDEGMKMTGLKLYKISMRGALTSLAREETEILKKIDGPGILLKPQKSLITAFLQKNYMFEFLSQGKIVTDYLSSEDIASDQIGEM